MSRKKIITITIFLTVLFLTAVPSWAQFRKSREGTKQQVAANEAAAAAALAAMLEGKQYTIEELSELADVSRATKDYEGLAFALQKWTALEPTRFSIRLEHGEALIALKKYTEAISVLLSASALIPSDEAPHRLLARIYAIQGNEKQRGAHLVNAARLAQRNWENQYNLAVYYIGIGRLADAEKLLVRTMELNSGFAPAKFELGKLMFGRKDIEGAFRMFDEAVLINPKNALYQAHYAYVASISLRHGIARNNIDIALKIAPTNVDVLCLAAKVELNLGNNSAAERHARSALRQSPANMRALEILGDVFAAEFKYKEACGAYVTVWEKAGHSEELAFKLGTAFALNGQWKEAKPIFDAIAVKDPNNGEVLYRLAEIYCELGDFKQADAMLMLNRFGDSKKNLVWQKAGQGKMYEAKKEYASALTAYRAASLIDAENPHVNAGIGRMLKRNKADLDSAMIYFQTANRLEPGNIRHLMAMASVHEAKKELGDAAAIYEKITARNPAKWELYLTIADIREKEGNIQSAILNLNRAARYNPKDSGIYFNLGRLYQVTQQYDLAINAYQTAVGDKPNEQTVEALKHIGDIYYTKLTNEKKALEYFRRYVRSGGKDNSVEFIIRRMTEKKS